MLTLHILPYFLEFLDWAMSHYQRNHSHVVISLDGLECLINRLKSDVWVLQSKSKNNAVLRIGRKAQIASIVLKTMEGLKKISSCKKYSCRVEKGLQSFIATLSFIFENSPWHEILEIMNSRITPKNFSCSDSSSIAIYGNFTFISNHKK